MPAFTDLAHLTLDIIRRYAFGYHFNRLLSGRIMRKRFIPLYDYLPVTENKRAKVAREITDGTVLEVNSYRLIFQFDLAIYYKFCLE